MTDAEKIEAVDALLALGRVSFCPNGLPGLPPSETASRSLVFDAEVDGLEHRLAKRCVAALNTMIPEREMFVAAVMNVAANYLDPDLYECFLSTGHNILADRREAKGD